MLYLCILLFAVLFAGIAMTIGEGLWTNTVSFLAVWLSSSLALLIGPNFGLWMQEQFDKNDPQFTWYFVFAGFWLVFFLAALIIRTLFDRISRVRVRFIPQLEAVCGPLMGLLVAAAFTSFCAVTLWVGPIGARAWNAAEASDWQKTTFEYMTSPMLTMNKAWGGQKATKGFGS